MGEILVSYTAQLFPSELCALKSSYYPKKCLGSFTPKDTPRQLVDVWHKRAFAEDLCCRLYIS